MLGRMFDAIQFRGFKQDTVETLARWSGVPVYNGLTDEWHPTQVLADLMTLEEAFGSPARAASSSSSGDGRNNVAHTLLVGCAQMGVHVTIVAPAVAAPGGGGRRAGRDGPQAAAAAVQVTDDIAEGGARARTRSTRTCGSPWARRRRARSASPSCRPTRSTRRLMEQTGNADAIFLHCLPAVKGKEVTVEVIEGPRSRVWDEAENRKHTIKAMMLATL